MLRFQDRSLSARLLAAVATISLLLALGGCGSQDSGGAPSVGSGGGAGGGGGGGGGGGTPPPQPKVTLGDPSVATLTAGVGSTTITATVTAASGSAAPDGTIVTFVVSPSSVAAAEDTTVPVSGGHAQATIRPLKAGTATITAKALGVTSTAKSLAVLAPQLTIATDKTTIPASAPGSGGATLSVTARDNLGTPVSGLSVSFSTNFGSLTPVTSPEAGKYQVTLTSTQTGTALVSASALGGTTDSVAISVTAGSVASLSVTPTPSQIKKGATSQSSSEIAVEAKDALGNPTGNVSVTVSSSPANVGGIPAGAGVVVLDTEGKGKVTFTSGPGQFGTATITATADNPDPTPDFTNNTATIQAVLDRAGEPANILLAVEPVDGRITVAGVGGNERAKITATVVDIEGNPIDDAKLTSNIEFRITKAPGNGGVERPFLDGQDPATGKLILTTSGGVVSANLQSGIRPGTVEISVTVTRAKDGTLLPVPLSAVVPQITIEGGPAASLYLSPSNGVSSNADGTITHEYFAVLSDEYGNAVPDGTSVYFGQFLNILDECRTLPPVDNPGLALAETFVPTVGFVAKTCADGILDASGSLTTASGTFQTAKVTSGDTWVSISKDNPYGLGGYLVDSVLGQTSLALETTFDFSSPATGLEWAVGNNKDLSGAVFTPGAVVPTKDGIARWPNTYAGELVNRVSYVHAETGGKGLGHARWFHLRWVAPTQVAVIGPAEVSPGATAFYTVNVQDSSGPTPYWIPDLLTLVSADGGSLGAYGFYNRSWESPGGSVYFLTSSREITVDYPGGEGGFFWTAPLADSGTKFSLFVSAGGTLKTLEVKIK